MFENWAPKSPCVHHQFPQEAAKCWGMLEVPLSFSDQPIWISTEKRLRCRWFLKFRISPRQVVSASKHALGIRNPCGNLCQKCPSNGLPQTCIWHFEGRRPTSDPTCVCALAACANRKPRRGNLGWELHGFLDSYFRSWKWMVKYYTRIANCGSIGINEFSSHQSCVSDSKSSIHTGNWCLRNSCLRQKNNNKKW